MYKIIVLLVLSSCGNTTNPNPPCIPNCSGKECGDDGCNGSCGYCYTSETCSNFQCVTTDKCYGIDCSKHGQCITSNNEAICQCDTGYHLKKGTKLTCVSDTKAVSKETEQSIFVSCTKSSSDYNYCDGMYKDILKVAPVGSYDGQKIAFIKFDFSDYKTSDSIQSAILRLYCAGKINQSEEPLEVEIYRVTTINWDRCQVTCNNQPTVFPVPWDNFSVTDQDCDYVEKDITLLVKGWIDGTIPNYDEKIVNGGIALFGISDDPLYVHKSFDHRVFLEMEITNNE